MNEKRFDGKAAAYAAFRPSYPQAFIDYLYTRVGFTPASPIADIGAGTGILTKLLLERGNSVYAVEPNADMRGEAERSLGGFANYHSLPGTAEATQLADHSVAFVTVAQAFHWFDRAKFRQECHRILTPGGRVALVWNSRVPNDNLARDSDALYAKYCEPYRDSASGSAPKPPNGTRGIFASDEDFSDFFTAPWEVHEFPNDLTVNLETFLGRNLSSSYTPKPDQPNHHPFLAALTELFHAYSHDGLLVMPTVAKSYVGTVD